MPRKPKITWLPSKHWQGCLAYFSPPDCIVIYKFPWVPRFLYERFVLRHELGHFHGISKDGCPARHKWCVMVEERIVGERWI